MEHGEYRDEGMSLGEILDVLRARRRKILLLSTGAAALALFVLLLKPNVYTASAVVLPAVDEKALMSPAAGAFASLGIDLGQGARLEDLETLFRSNDLTVRVFKNHDLWSVLEADTNGPPAVRPGAPLRERLFGNIRDRVFGNWKERLFGKSAVPPSRGEWDAIRASKELLKVSVNKKAGNIVLSFDSPSSEGSAAIVGYYLEEGKSTLQEEALNRATKNIRFVEEQIGKTVDPLTRDRMYQMYGAEMERLMKARNREQFGFRIADSPRPPDRKSRPKRLTGALMAFFLVAMGSSAYELLNRERKALPSGPGGEEPMPEIGQASS